MAHLKAARILQMSSLSVSLMNTADFLMCVLGSQELRLSPAFLARFESSETRVDQFLPKSTLPCIVYGSGDEE